MDKKETEPINFPDFYFETRFKFDNKIDDIPSSFSIITAYATTGERWTDKENREADARLSSELKNAGVLCWRVTGYSPTTGHSEPGWATPLSANEACRLGMRYLQHAVFVVNEGILRVMLCETGDHRIIGSISEHLDMD